MAELADATDLKSVEGKPHGGSSPPGAIINTPENTMHLITKLVVSLVLELSSSDHVVYPVDDLICNIPQFSDAPRFSLGGIGRGDYTNTTGYTETKEDRIDIIRMIIEEDCRSRGIAAKVFFFNGNFIVKEIK